MKKHRPSGRRGTLYIVATPIGHRADITFRAVELLQKVDLIAAEDTRHARRLLAAYGIGTPLRSYHEHNETGTVIALIQHLEEGGTLALVADAGTPLINDPGFVLVREARNRGIEVVPIPGCCALIAALSVSGLATDRFSFEGFPPRTTATRIAWFTQLLDNPRTLIFYESSHRIKQCLEDLSAVFPPERAIVIAREMTKVHETVIKTTVENLGRLIDSESYLQKGELVVLVEGAAPAKRSFDSLHPDQERTLSILLRECNLKTAVALATEITGARRKAIYHAALQLLGKADE